MKSNDLKALRTRERKLLGEIENIELEKKDINSRLNSKSRELNSLKVKITNLQKGVKVSEHAKLRYIERVLGINLKEIEALILDKPTEKIINTTQNGKINKDGFRLIFKNKQIVTVEVD